METEVREQVENFLRTVNCERLTDFSMPSPISLSVLLQAICAKCSKTLDNSRVCPECFEASLSLETLCVSEQKKKSAPEVRHTHGHKQKQAHTEKDSNYVCNLVYVSALLCDGPMRLMSPSVPVVNVNQGSVARLQCWKQKLKDTVAYLFNPIHYLC